MIVSRTLSLSDPMALLCLIGRAVRDAGQVNLLMQLMVVSGHSPALRHAMLAWLATEERFAHLEFGPQRGVVEDGWGGEDGLYRGFMTPRGRVVLWRHVTRFGLAVVIPVVTAALVRVRIVPVGALGWSAVRVMAASAFFHVFLRGEALGENCALIVPVS